MSITRLQQARQMYAMGQRVGRIAFGGGGSYSSQGGYQGGGGSATGGSKGSKAGGAGTGVDGQGGTGGSNEGNTQVVDTTSKKYTETPLSAMSTNPLDIKEQYRLGTKINPPSTFTNNYSVTFDQPYMTKGLETIRKDNYIDRLNLKGATYQPPNLPFFVPGSTLIKTLGSFGFDKNKNFFEENVAGKYGYGYGLKDFEKYMSDRTSGKVGAYGNENMGQNAINARSGGDNGIMDVYNNTTDDTTDDTTTDDELLLRFLGADSTLDPAAAGVANTDELRAMILERAKNLYT